VNRIDPESRTQRQNEGYHDHSRCPSDSRQ
jgi:hypothetical protein